MSVLNELKKIKDLSGKTNLCVSCIDGTVVKGLYRGYTSELDNEPEIAQIDILSKESNGLIGILETEIKSIAVIN